MREYSQYFPEGNSSKIIEKLKKISKELGTQTKYGKLYPKRKTFH